MRPIAFSGALDGLKVVEFTHVIAGPFAGLQLCQLGAQVVKIEPPGDGDFLRSLADGERTYRVLNAPKRRRALDLKTPEMRDEALRECERADVVLDSFRPGTLARLGLGYERLSAINPGLVYCSISGYGSQTAGLAGRGAYDHVVQALTGIAMQSGHPGDPPVKVGFTLVDNATAMLAVQAVLAALLRRAATGHGQFIEVSMWRAALQLMYTHAATCLNHDTDMPRVGNVGATGSPGSRFVACSDGWLALGANTPAQIAALEGLLTPLSGASDDDGHLVRRLDAHFARLGVDEAEAIVSAAGVPTARVRTAHEFLTWARSTGLFTPERASPDDVLLGPGPGWRCFEPGPAVEAPPRTQASRAA